MARLTNKIDALKNEVLDQINEFALDESEWLDSPTEEQVNAIEHQILTVLITALNNRLAEVS